MSLATASLTSGNSILAHHIIKNIVGHVLLHIRRCFFSYGKMINLSNAYQLHQKVHNSLLLFIIKVFPSDKNPQAKDFQQPLLGKIPILILYFCFEQYFLLHCNLHVLPYHNSGILGFGIQNECYLVLRAEQLHIHYTFDL